MTVSTDCKVGSCLASQLCLLLMKTPLHAHVSMPPTQASSLTLTAFLFILLHHAAASNYNRFIIKYLQHTVLSQSTAHFHTMEIPFEKDYLVGGDNFLERWPNIKCFHHGEYQALHIAATQSQLFKWLSSKFGKPECGKPPTMCFHGISWPNVIDWFWKHTLIFQMQNRSTCFRACTNRGLREWKQRKQCCLYPRPEKTAALSFKIAGSIWITPSIKVE